MAIAFDSYSYPGNGTGSPFTWTHVSTATGKNPAGLVAIEALSGDVVTAVTWGGSSMTLVDKQNRGDGRWNYLWIITGQSSGSQTISVTNTEGVQLSCGSISYTGVLSTGQPDSKNKGTGSSSVATLSTTAIANNCWLVGVIDFLSGSPSAGANTILRGTGSNVLFGDRNGVLSPAGSGSLNFTTGSASWSIIMVSLAPAADTNSYWAWGLGTSGEIGDGSSINRSSPVQIAGTWAFASGGRPNAAGIKSSANSLWVWGSGSNGALGQGNTNSASSPVQLAGTWALASMGYNNGAAIKATDLSLWVWGSNYLGQLGVGDVADRSSPVQLAGTWSSAWGSISMGTLSGAAIKNDGSLWTWGNNDQGQLGLGNTVVRSSPVQVAGTWKTISVYNSTMVGIKASDNSLWVWGQGATGRLGTGDVVNRSSPTQLAGTWATAVVADGVGMAIKNDGSLWSWGVGTNGQTGQGNTVNRSSPTQLAGTWADVFFGQNAAGAIKTNNSLWMWGNNSAGRLGQGDTINRSSPTQVTGTWSYVGRGSRVNQSLQTAAAASSVNSNFFMFM